MTNLILWKDGSHNMQCKKNSAVFPDRSITQLFQIQLTLSCNLPLHELNICIWLCICFCVLKIKKNQKNTIISFLNCTASQVAQCQPYTDLSRDSCFLWNSFEPDWSHWCTAVIPALRRLRQDELWELEDSLACRVTFSSSIALHFSQEWK